MSPTPSSSTPAQQNKTLHPSSRTTNLPEQRMLGIRSFGSNLSLCMGGKSTQTSEDILSVVPPSSPYLRLQDQML